MVFAKIVHGYHKITHSNQTIYPCISNYFSLSNHLRVGSARIVQTYIQNMIDYTLEVDYIAKVLIHES